MKKDLYMLECRYTHEHYTWSTAMQVIGKRKIICSKSLWIFGQLYTIDWQSGISTVILLSVEMQPGISTLLFERKDAFERLLDNIDSHFAY